jgi:S-(hydroxymethyl)glutathione dehydrogenase/alcohol dehydrogenase
VSADPVNVDGQRTSFIPSCGSCRDCHTGRLNLCDLGAILLDGQLPDGTFRFHLGSEDVGGVCSVGTFSQYATVSQHSLVKIDEWLPLEKAVLVSCGVPTGWRTAVNGGNIRPGDTTVIYGAGGMGMNAVQAAVQCGAKNVVVVDSQQLEQVNEGYRDLVAGQLIRGVVALEH